MRCINERGRTICYRKKQIDVSLSRVSPVIDYEFRHSIFGYFDNVMTKFFVNNSNKLMLVCWITNILFLALILSSSGVIFRCFVYILSIMFKDHGVNFGVAISLSVLFFFLSTILVPRVWENLGTRLHVLLSREQWKEKKPSCITLSFNVLTLTKVNIYRRLQKRIKL